METDEIAAAVLVRRREVVGRMLAGKNGQEFVRLGEAYAALMGHPAPTIVLDPEGDFDDLEAEYETVVEAKPSRGLQPGALPAAMLEILEREPVIWSYADLVPDLKDKGFDVIGADGKIKSSVRTAAMNLDNLGVAERTTGGFIYASKFHDEFVRAGSVGPAPTLIDPDSEGDA
jgi:hypothetical protein